MIIPFCELVKRNQRPGMVVVEVGCWKGETTIGYLATVAANGGKVYVVDNFCGNPTAVGEHEYNEGNDQTIYEALVNNIKLTGYSDIVEIIKSNSYDAARLFADKSIDICFIDADHRYEFVLRDIKAFLPKIKMDGIICGDDCESLNLVNTFSMADLKVDCLTISDNAVVHAGVVQAVYDVFGSEVELLHDPEHHVNPIWVKYLQPGPESKVVQSVDLLINCHSFLETTYIGLQMLRGLCPHPNVMVYMSDCRGTTLSKPRICDIQRLTNEFIVSKVHREGRNGCHISNVEAFRSYLSKSVVKPYVIYTFQDHWILNLSKLSQHLAYMIEGNYDGMNIETSMCDSYDSRVCWGTSFFAIKPYLLKLLAYDGRFTEPVTTWEYLFQDCLDGIVNWYITNKDSYLIHQYGYKPSLGFAHVQSYNEKLHFIKLWEERYGKKLDYDEEQLAKETSQYYYPEFWPFNNLPKTLEDGNSDIIPGTLSLENKITIGVDIERFGSKDVSYGGKMIC